MTNALSLGLINYSKTHTHTYTLIHFPPSNIISIKKNNNILIKPTLFIVDCCYFYLGQTNFRHGIKMGEENIECKLRLPKNYFFLSFMLQKILSFCVCVLLLSSFFLFNYFKIKFINFSFRRCLLVIASLFYFFSLSLSYFLARFEQKI